MKSCDRELRTLLRTLTNLVAVACLFVFSSYGVKHGYDVGEDSRQSKPCT